MALDIWFQNDILNVLRSAHVASEGSASLAQELVANSELRKVGLEPLLEIYRRGYNTALAAVAVAFGIDISVPEQSRISPEPQHQALGGGTSELMPATSRQLPRFDSAGFLWRVRECESRRK